MSWREIDRLRKDPVGFRTLAKALLAFEDLTEWESGFLESIVRLVGVKEFSVRQGETLLQIRDGTLLVETVRGFSVATLARRCHDARLDLAEEDESWIEGLGANVTTIKRRQAGRLLRIACHLGIVDAPEFA